MSNTSLTVELGERAYRIVIDAGLLRDASAFADAIRGDHVVIVSNETVAPLYLPTLRETLSEYRQIVHILPDGERHKRLPMISDIIDSAVGQQAARDATFIALGGGVVGDMTGFAAACFMRGVPFIQVPTTLLAQVDSSVGGKTGVNHISGKNLIGAFHQPARVVIDTTTLKTLPAREFAAGMAEVIKHGLIMDADYFDWLEANIDALMQRDDDALRPAILRSCEIKAAVVAADEREQGQRALLNFGHTFAHAIESVTGYSQWLHGEAVAIGMVMAARMSGLPDAAQQRIAALLAAAGLPTDAGDIDGDALHAAMAHDKKVQAGRVRLILLREIGDAFVTSDYDDVRLLALLRGNR